MKLSSALTFFTAALLLGSVFFARPLQAQENRPLRIIAIFAHPDDAEAKMGGTTALWAEMGHEIKFVSLTNGDHGHQDMGGGPLANRRRAEAVEAARRLGVKEYIVMDNHDAELMPHLHIRQDVIRMIRRWNADIVIGLRTNDYHPDHRYAGVLVMDAAYMVVVPNVAPDTPPLTQNPVFLYMHDRFQRPYPFQNDIVVAIDKVIDNKIDGLDAHDSQMYEWLPWVGGTLDQVPQSAEDRRAWLAQRWIRPNVTDAHRPALEKFYGPAVAGQIRYVEGFEIAEYGRQPSDEEIRRLFPMLGNF
jgi:LmbE family N-acetylglucosaminyl deacetylase